ncbi:MAG: rod shape-determining protein MreD [bacterium]
MQAQAAPRVSWTLILFLVVLHLFLRLTLGYGHSAPDLFVVALLLATREVSLGTGSLLGLLLGILEDGFSVVSFGAHAFSFSVLGLVSGRIRDIFVGDSAIFMAAYFFLGKFLRDLLYWIAVGDLARDPFIDIFLPDALLAATYVGLVGVGVSMVSETTSMRV